jgi:hypothetical protein
MDAGASLRAIHKNTGISQQTVWQMVQAVKRYDGWPEPKPDSEPIQFVPYKDTKNWD